VVAVAAIVPPGVPLFAGDCRAFTPDGATGAYTVPGPTFRCRLAHPRTGAGTTVLDRAELAATRRLIWDPAVALAPDCEVLDPDGARWRPVAGTLALLRDWTGAPVYRVCEAVAGGRVTS
jgi:hypothetical protein